MYLKTFFFLITISLCLPCAGREIGPSDAMAALDESSGGAKDKGVVELPPFVVEASSQARLKINFRYHMIWSGLKNFTFTEVTASWAKAGIRVGDRVIGIDGKPTEGMRLRDFGAWLREKLNPLKSKKTSEVPIVFAIQSIGSNTTRSVKLMLKSSTSLTFYNDGF